MQILGYFTSLGIGICFGNRPIADFFHDQTIFLKDYELYIIGHSLMLTLTVQSQLLMCGDSNLLFYFCRAKLDWLIRSATLCKCGRAVRIEGHQERPEIAPMTETNLWPLITVVKGHCSLISGSAILSLTHLDLPKLSLWPFWLDLV